MHYGKCFKKHICGQWCDLRCRSCYRKDPTHICKDFVQWKCNQLDKPPYVCNACDKYKWCILPRALYVAAKAHKTYEKNLIQPFLWDSFPLMNGMIEWVEELRLIQ